MEPAVADAISIAIGVLVTTLVMVIAYKYY